MRFSLRLLLPCHHGLLTNHYHRFPALHSCCWSNCLIYDNPPCTFSVLFLQHHLITSPHNTDFLPPFPRFGSRLSPQSSISIQQPYRFNSTVYHSRRRPSNRLLRHRCSILSHRRFVTKISGTDVPYPITHLLTHSDSCPSRKSSEHTCCFYLHTTVPYVYAAEWITS